MSKEEGVFDSVSMDSLSDDFITFDEAGETLQDKEAAATEEKVEATQQKETKQDFIEFDDTGSTGEEQPTTEVEDEDGEPNFETEEKDTIVSEETPDDEESPSSPISSFASALLEAGVLPNLSEENIPQDFESMAEAVNNEIIAGINNWVENLPPDLKTVLENYQEGVPLDKTIANVSRQVEYAQISEEKLAENVNLQKNILKQEMEARGYSEDRINKYIEKFEDLGDLEEESKIALANLKENEKARQAELQQQAKLQQQQAQEAHKKQLQQIQESITKSEEIIPGLKLNKTQKEKIYKSMTTAVDQDQYGNPINAIMKKRMENPVDFEIKLNYLFNLTNGFEDWSSIIKKAKTNAVKDFESALRGGDHTTHFKAGKPKGDPNQLNTDDALYKGLNSIFGKK